MKRLCLGLAAMLIAAPVAAHTAGYKIKEIAPGIWQVRASASAASGGFDQARAIALYRGGELLKARGFTHMRILDSGGWELNSADGSYSPLSSGPGYATLVVRGATGPDDVAGCRSRDTSRCMTRPIAAVMAETRL
jgi:hypothetical protein